MTGFGQVGPYRRRPGFGTLAETMSGFAALTGQPDGPPTLPPFGLADGVAALATAYAVMTTLHAREHTGEGQVIDLAIIEPILATLGPQITRWDQLGTVQHRTGNRSANNAPRNTYRTADGRWVAVSTSSQNIAERVMRLVGRRDEVVAAFEEAEAAVAPIYDASDIAKDPQFDALDTVISVDDDDLGSVACRTSCSGCQRRQGPRVLGLARRGG